LIVYNYSAFILDRINNIFFMRSSILPCNAIINDSDISAMYSIPQINNIHLDTRCVDADQKEAFLKLFDTQGNPMTRFPVCRIYHQNALLKSFSGRGKVAEHKLFYLHPQYRGNGIANNLSFNEDNTYRRNGFIEIQLQAAWDGIVVWQKKGFQYVSPKTEYKVITAWRVYFTNVFNELSLEEQADIIRQYKRIKDIPKKYLLPEGKQSFTDWLDGKNLVPVDDMYRRL